MDGTVFQYAALILGVLGFGITWTAGVIGITRAVENIKQDTTNKVAEARAVHVESLAELRAELLDLQKQEEHNFGEVAAALRQKIADVEKEMHEIEIWGRDHYAEKDDLRDILRDLKEMRAEIKEDFRDLTKKIDAKDH